MKPRIAFFGAAILLVSSGLISCSSRPKEVSAAADVVHDVTLVTAQERKVPDTFEAIGTVRARQSAPIASQVMGYVVSLSVREGDAVRQGQTIAVIDDGQAAAGVAQAQGAVSAARQQVTAAESELALAKSTLARYQSLYEKKSLSPQEFDEVKARFQAASARKDVALSNQTQAIAALSQSKLVLDHTRVRAPFNGVVTARTVDPGALAVPGTVLLTVEDTARYRLEASVDERELKYVHLGQSVPVAVDAIPNEVFNGKIVQIVPAADSATRSFIVKLELESNPGLRSGLFGRARLTRGERQSLTIPQSAVLERGQLREVYVLNADRIATLRYVTLGAAAEAQVEVLSGLSAGETVVATPGERELGGKRIEVR